MNSPPKEKKEEITPPNSFTSKPPTPKSLPKNRRPLPGAIVDIIQLFKNIQRGVDTDRSPWRTYHLTPEDYEELVHLLEQDEHLWGYVEDKIRFDYSPGEQKLIVRMPSELHDTFARQVDVCIENQLAQLRDGTDAVARFALAIVSQGNADTWLMDKDDKKKRHKRSPDGRFRHLGAKFPGVIMEISYSQKRKDLPVLAHDYIKGSRGHIRVVVGLDLEYRKPSSSLQSRQATVSVWRAEIIHPDNKKKLIARKVVDNEVFILSLFHYVHLLITVAIPRRPGKSYG